MLVRPRSHHQMQRGVGMTRNWTTNAARDRGRKGTRLERAFPFFHGRFPLGPQVAPQAWSVCYGGKDRTTEVYSMKVVFLGIRATIYTHNWKNLILARTGMQRPPSRRPSAAAAAAGLRPSDSKCLEAELQRSRRRRRSEELLVCLLSLPSS